MQVCTQLKQPFILSEQHQFPRCFDGCTWEFHGCFVLSVPEEPKILHASGCEDNLLWWVLCFHDFVENFLSHISIFYYQNSSGSLAELLAPHRDNLDRK